MHKLNRVLLSLSACLACAPNLTAGIKAQGADADTNHQMFKIEHNPLPATITAFQKMDFDRRMEQQEYLRQKYHTNLFIDAVRYHILKSDEMLWDDRLIRSIEMTYLGREAGSLPQGITIQKAASLCGLKRLTAFQEFKAKNKTDFFLKDKDEFYRGGLNAEMEAISEISILFDVDEWVAFRTMVADENEAFPQSGGYLSHSLYRAEIMRRAAFRLKQEHTAHSTQTR